MNLHKLVNPSFVVFVFRLFAIFFIISLFISITADILQTEGIYTIKGNYWSIAGFIFAIFALFAIFVAISNYTFFAFSIKKSTALFGVIIALLLFPLVYSLTPSLSSLKENAQSQVRRDLRFKADDINDEIVKNGKLNESNLIDNQFEIKNKIRMKLFPMENLVVSGGVLLNKNTKIENKIWDKSNSNSLENGISYNSDVKKMENLKTALDENSNIVAYFKEEKIEGKEEFSLFGLRPEHTNVRNCYVIKYRITYKDLNESMGKNESCKILPNGEIDAITKPSLSILIDNTPTPDQSDVSKLEVWIVSDNQKNKNHIGSSDLFSVSTAKINHLENEINRNAYCIEGYHMGVPDEKYSIVIGKKFVANRVFTGYISEVKKEACSLSYSH